MDGKIAVKIKTQDGIDARYYYQYIKCEDVLGNILDDWFVVEYLGKPIGGLFETKELAEEYAKQHALENE